MEVISAATGVSQVLPQVAGHPLKQGSQPQTQGNNSPLLQHTAGLGLGRLD